MACAPVPFVTTSAQCANAQSSIDQMNAVFAQFGSPANYTQQVQAITANLAAQMPYAYSTIGVGVGMCSTVFQIGIQADLLTNQMLSDNGQATVPGPSCLDQSAISAPGLMAGLGGIGLGVAALAAVFIFMEMKK